MTHTTVDRWACSGCPAEHDAPHDTVELPHGWVRIAAYLGDERGIGQDVDLVSGDVDGGPDLHFCECCQDVALKALAGWRRS